MVPKRTEFCGVLVDLHSAAGGGVDIVATGGDFFPFFFGGTFFG